MGTHSLCDFSLTHYRATLVAYLQQGYFVGSFGEYLARGGDEILGRKQMLLRHDIDFSLAYLPGMLQVERELGVRSTSFVRVRAPNYQVDTEDSIAVVRQAHADGFEIGFHYEFGEHTTDPKQQLEEDKRRLERALGEPVSGASCHKPASTGFRIDTRQVQQLGLQYEAYDERFMKPFKYISDSRRRWREGCFCRWLGEPALHVLVHPVWWRPGSDVKLESILEAI